MSSSCSSCSLLKISWENEGDFDEVEMMAQYKRRDSPKKQIDRTVRQ